MKRYWNIKPLADCEKVRLLSNELQIDEVLAELLIQRNVNTFDEARTFFRPSLNNLHNPFLMEDMDRAVDRLLSAIRNSEKIMIYGDYDVDGTTSVALVYSFLYEHYQNLEFYIPDRYLEGYGVSFKGIDFAADSGCRLIIALDCGIKAVEKVAYANRLGIDFIICDHHTPGDALPNAIACLDSKRADCNYPDKNLSGCGVSFKLMQAFCKKQNIPEETLYEYLDLVAVSIASDIVPITGENRILAFYGLKKLNSSPRTGLKSIICTAGMEEKELHISDVVFKIGPRINAAGRIETGRNAVDLLVSDDESLASQMSTSINACNETRKDLDRDITQKALEKIAAFDALENRKTTVLYDPEWHKGVIGIVASRLTETYYRPTIILTESKGMATGSARSVDGFDLYRAIDACSDLLENFGGHMYAAGLTLKVENIPAFINRFEETVAQTILPEQLIPKINIDAEIELGDIKPKFFRILKQFRPFGPGNMKPVFVTRNVIDYGTSKLVGKDRNHLKLELIDRHSCAIIQGVGFSMGDYIDQIKKGEPFDICYTIEENVYNGKTSIQIMVKDIKFNS
ncbi:MAG: single-stranded-DNA-specific exonuclease RecJ [Cytophagaceae bacterium]|jgi:single-stranded-DNA-specific exonuclease|nr:single-stranded-DNA-specific exonuclease RecJ [Cytophagaceae bacterium]